MAYSKKISTSAKAGSGLTNLFHQISNINSRRSHKLLKQIAQLFRYRILMPCAYWACPGQDKIIEICCPRSLQDWEGPIKHLLADN